MSRMQMHSGVGMGAGTLRDDRGKGIPVVTLYFAKDPELLERMEESEDFDPSDENLWHRFVLPIHAARQLAFDLNETIDAAIRGPKGVEEHGPVEDHHWKLWAYNEEEGAEEIVAWGDRDKILQSMQERADRNGDVWVIDPDGNKHLPE